jgi:hypothetical protein
LQLLQAFHGKLIEVEGASAIATALAPG